MLPYQVGSNRKVNAIYPLLDPIYRYIVQYFSFPENNRLNLYYVSSKVAWSQISYLCTSIIEELC